MGRPKGRVSDTENIGLRMPNDLIESMDNYAKEHGLNRSSVINRAVGNLVNSLECIKCGSLNSEGSKVCSNCGAELFSDDQIKGILQLMTYKLYTGKFESSKKAEYLSLNLKMHGLVEEKLKEIFKISEGLKLKTHVESFINKKSEVDRYVASVVFITPDGTALAPIGDDNKIIYDAEDVYRFVKLECGIIPAEVENRLMGEIMLHNETLPTSMQEDTGEIRK